MKPRSETLWTPKSGWVVQCTHPNSIFEDLHLLLILIPRVTSMSRYHPSRILTLWASHFWSYSTHTTMSHKFWNLHTCCWAWSGEVCVSQLGLEKILSSPWDSITWGLCWTPSCENSHSQSIHYFEPWFTHAFPDLTHFLIQSSSPLWTLDHLTPSLILCLFRLSISRHMESHPSNSDSLMEPPITSSHRH